MDIQPDYKASFIQLCLVYQIGHPSMTGWDGLGWDILWVLVSPQPARLQSTKFDTWLCKELRWKRIFSSTFLHNRYELRVSLSPTFSMSSIPISMSEMWKCWVELFGAEGKFGLWAGGAGPGNCPWRVLCAHWRTQFDGKSDLLHLPLPHKKTLHGREKYHQILLRQSSAEIFVTILDQIMSGQYVQSQWKFFEYLKL